MKQLGQAKKREEKCSEDLQGKKEVAQVGVPQGKQKEAELTILPQARQTPVNFLVLRMPR